MKTKEENLVDHITNELNSSIFKQEKFVDSMSREHRTLQQDFTRLCFAWIETLSETEERFSDHRNKASLEVSKKIIEAYKEKQEGYMKNVNPSQLLPKI